MFRLVAIFCTTGAVVASIACLSGCTAGGASSGTSHQSVLQETSRPQMHASSGELVYTCLYSTNTCEWFPEGSNVVAGTIGGLTGPQGLAVGAGLNTDVYIANTGANNVLVYPINSSTLKATLNDAGYYPVDIAVAKSGTVFVANIFDTSGNPGNVTVFKPGGTTIARKIKDPNFYEVISDTIDELNDLVVCYNDRSGVGACDEFPGGKGPGTTIVSGLSFAGGSAFDATENLVVADQLGHVNIYSPNDGSQCNTISSTGPSIAFDKSQNDLFVADSGTGDIEEETYAGCSGGGKIEFTYTAGSSGSLAGVAVDPGPRN